MKHELVRSLTFIGVLAASAGCAAAQPPRELIAARTAYARAAVGDAARLTPAALHDAKVALESAESAFNEDPDAPTTRDKAYVAVRKAELAEVLASSAAAKREEYQAHAQSQSEKDQSARQGRVELVQARQHLALTEQRLESSDRSLATERMAHADADQRARDALAKLALANSLAVRDEPRGTVVSIPSGVLFASGKATLLPGAQAKLDAVAEVLSHEVDHAITIEGHTDAQGSDAANLELSQRRAQTVREYFASHGVPAEQMTATGVGESRPIADNATPEGRANNRRVEIVVQPTERR